MQIDAGTALRIRELEAEVARLRQCLDDFGMHTTNCDIVYYDYMGDHKCTCGLTAARQRTPDTATDGKAE
jgi:hypothetical protein